MAVFFKIAHWIKLEGASRGNPAPSAASGKEKLRAQRQHFQVTREAMTKLSPPV